METQDQDDSLYEHYAFTADSGQQPLRVDKFLMNRIENATRNKIQQAAKAGSVHVNDLAVKSNYKVKGGDKVQVLFAHPPYENLLVGEEIPLDIVYEDDTLVVVNKAAGMVVHPGHGNYSGTLLNALLHHFESLPLNTNERPGLVHRIDKDTIQGHIGRDPKNRLLMTVFPDGDQGKEAITHYEVVERFGYTTLLRCQLETGRTHQIRAHLKSIGHTLFSDDRYGGNHILKGTTFTKYKQFVDNCFKLLPRQALHAQTLGFVHPISGKSMSFEAALPNDMLAALDKWRHYAKHRLD